MPGKTKAEQQAEKNEARLKHVETRTQLKTAKAEAKAAKKAAKKKARAIKKAARVEAEATKKAAKAKAKLAKAEAKVAMKSARAELATASAEAAAKTAKADIEVLKAKNSVKAVRLELNLSAKMRITLWFTLMVLLLSALVLVLVLLMNGTASTDNPVGRLIQVVSGNANDVEFDHGTIDWDDLDMYDSGVYCMFYDEQGNILRGALPEGLDTSLPLIANKVRTVPVDGVDHYIYDYLLDVEVADIWIRGAISSEDHSGIMRTIVILTATILPALLLLTAVGGWLIARAAFRPMEKIMDAANDIGDGNDLTARIDLKRGPAEMKRLSRTFDAMFARLEASFNAEKQFASDASHELRTPITVILAECDRARRKDVTREDFLASVDVIDEQGKNMSKLVQSLLGLTRMERGTEAYPLRRGCLSELVEACCGEFAPADERGITLRTAIQPDIYADFNSTLISRVLQNLLQNAYKYGNDDGHIAVSLSASGDKAVLAVKDDGIGISKEDQEKVFKRFWQGDPSRSEDGSGLGLSMVAEIAKLHGGRAEVSSAPGHGSTFTVSIPLK